MCLHNKKSDQPPFIRFQVWFFQHYVYLNSATNGQLLPWVQVLRASRGKFECHWCSQHSRHTTGSRASQIQWHPVCIGILQKHLNEGLAVESNIRSNNLVTTFRHSNTLPIYFWIYQDNLPALSRSIETQFQTSDHNTTYRYFFVYFKFRQMKTIVPPISTQSLNLDIVVADKSLILGASIHVALNFSHNDPGFSMFWSSNTISYLRGISTRKYPFLGLNELSNITSTFPAGVHLYQAIARRDRTVTRYTYSQAYTPLTKALDPSAFKNRPFLLALLLGKDHIKEQPDLSHIYNSTAKLLEYQQIQEAIGMELTKSEARLEFVLCAPRIEELFSINPATIKFVQTSCWSR